jgi:hypothetical protein
LITDIHQPHQLVLLVEDGPSVLASPSEPSLLQLTRGIAVTIQFHQGSKGLSPGIFAYPATLAGPQKQAATHIHHVKVGVTKRRKKLDGLSIHRYQPAHVHTHHTDKGDIGQTVGNGGIGGAGGVQVSAENIGIPSQTVKPSHIGIPNNVGSHPGARGAQFNGVAIQPDPPNQQLNH